MIGPLAYIGGKNRLANQIMAILPEHTTYVEPFCGGAQVFFHKEPSKVEVLNDLDGELINFLRICQWHHDELIRFMQYLVVSRAWFQILSRTESSTLTDVQRAARFLYLQKNCFGGLILKRHYHYGVIQRPNFNPARIPAIIKAAHERLQQVQLECLPYEEVLERYDRPTTLFYLDPPYWRRKLYKFNFTEKAFKELERRLFQIQGRFILSLDDHPEVRRLFCRWPMERVEVTYTAQTNPGKRYGEVLITNFQLAKNKDPAGTGSSLQANTNEHTGRLSRDAA